MERMQRAAHDSYQFLGAKEDFIETRNKLTAEQAKYFDQEIAIPEEERRARPKAAPDMDARFPAEAFLQWLYAYDATAETKKYLSKME